MSVPVGKWSDPQMNSSIFSHQVSSLFGWIFSLAIVNRWRRGFGSNASTLSARSICVNTWELQVQVHVDTYSHTYIEELVLLIPSWTTARFVLMQSPLPAFFQQAKKKMAMETGNEALLLSSRVSWSKAILGASNFSIARGWVRSAQANLLPSLKWKCSLVSRPATFLVTCNS